MRLSSTLGGVVCAVLAVLPGVAAAHNPLPGLEGFYVGLVHPLSTPDQALLLVGTALAFGSFSMPSLLPAFGALLLGLLAGLVWGQSDIESAQWLLVLAICAAVWAALLPGRGHRLLVGLAVLSGFGLGWASVPDAGATSDRAFTMSGSFFGAGLAILYLTGGVEVLRDRIKAHWLDISLRVIAAWVAAIAVIMLALSVAEPGLSA
ncbi:MAG: hypothetical protein AAF678_06015 [Pseudomonadota bacterium]